MIVVYRKSASGIVGEGPLFEFFLTESDSRFPRLANLAFPPKKTLLLAARRPLGVSVFADAGTAGVVAG